MARKENPSKIKALIEQLGYSHQQRSQLEQRLEQMHVLLAALIEQAGGTVTISPVALVEHYTIERSDDPTSGDLVFRVRRKP